MRDFSQGKIYMLVSPSTNLKYIGSTTETLRRRFSGHKNDLDCSSKVIIQVGDAEIVLIHDFACDSLEELETEEGRVQDLYPDKVNVRRARRTLEEKNKKNRELKSERRSKMTQEERDAKNKAIRELYAKKPQSEKSRNITQEQRDAINKRSRELYAKKKEAAKKNSLDISN